MRKLIILALVAAAVAAMVAILCGGEGRRGTNGKIVTNSDNLLRAESRSTPLIPTGRINSSSSITARSASGRPTARGSRSSLS